MPDHFPRFSRGDRGEHGEGRDEKNFCIFSVIPRLLARPLLRIGYGHVIILMNLAAMIQLKIIS